MKFDSANVKSIRFDNFRETITTKSKPRVHADTRIVVITSEAINSRQHKSGHKIAARLKTDIVASDILVAPRGTTLYGQILESNKSGRLVGKGSLRFTFTNMMIDNQMKSIVAYDVKAVISATGIKTVITTVLRVPRSD